ncbi:MAG: hypothetical protein R3351_05515, partial [Nitrospirales bacterium]|nr:hypothetical protein [Nitrospirales bacterium]
MANLIIGNTTHHSTMIWVRGGNFFNRVKVTVERDEDGSRSKPKEKNLSSSEDFIAVIPFNELDSSTRYKVSASFSSHKKRGTYEVQGTFCTFPQPETPEPFSFLHGSCNLSVVSLTNVGGLVIGALGMLAATQSLQRPTGGTFQAVIIKWVLKIGDLMAKVGYYLYTRVPYLVRYIQSVIRRTPRPEKPASTKKVTLIYVVFGLVYYLTEFKQ